MTFRDLVDLSVGSLWRIKLRATLTIAGVVIAIATFVAMLSFAAGNQRHISNIYNEFGLLTNMRVFPKSGNGASDSTVAEILDAEAIQELSHIPGVKLAYPYDALDVTAAIADTVVTTTARALPPGAMQTTLINKLLAGADFSEDTAREAILTHEMMELTGIEEPDSLIGRRIVISTRVASLDSALVLSVGDPRGEMFKIMRTVDFDSLSHPGYQRRVMRQEIGQRFERFFDGLMNHQMTVSDTLLVRAVVSEPPSYGMRTSPIVIPERTARRLSSTGFVLGDNPANLLTAMRSGSLFGPEGPADARSYRRVTLEIEPYANYKAVKDSVEALGFRAFSFAEEFDQIQRFMIFFYLGMGVLGVIALVTSSLGIINTLVMSITERRREIGVLKSLGGGEHEIRVLFLVESGVIGVVGSILGIVLGWLATRLVAFVLKIIMERKEVPVFDPFALPAWLILLAFAFGVTVSVLAGLYPAARAARVDPVVALRSE